MPLPDRATSLGPSIPDGLNAFGARRTLTRLLALEWVAAQLAELYAPDEARLWLYRPQALLDGQRAADHIQAGDIDSVLALIGQLRSGAYV